MIVAATKRKSRKTSAVASQRTRMITRESRWMWFLTQRVTATGSTEPPVEKEEEDGESDCIEAASRIRIHIETMSHS